MIECSVASLWLLCQEHTESGQEGQQENKATALIRPRDGGPS